MMSSVVPRTSVLVKGPASEPPTIALTFDDGPHPEYTPRLLDSLADKGFKATFFLIGEKAAQYPYLVKRICAEGHQIGNHTWSHTEPATTSTASFLAEVQRTRAYLNDLTGRDIRIVRPPKGELTIGKVKGLWQRKESCILWNRDPKDYRMASKGELAHWYRNFQPVAGDVVLLHDNHPFAGECVEELAAALRPYGVRTVCLEEWLPNPSKNGRSGDSSQWQRPIVRESVSPANV